MDDKDINCKGILINKLPLEMIMSQPVFAVSESADFSVVEEQFIDNHIRHLPVVDEDNRIIGIISQRDFYRTVTPRTNAEGKVFWAPNLLVDSDDCFYDKQSLHDYRLSQVMHKNPIVLTPEDLLEDAVHLMVHKKIGCIPIISERREVVGIVTRFDILKVLDDLLANTTSLYN